MKRFNIKKYCCLMITLSFLSTLIGCEKKNSTAEDNSDTTIFQSVTSQEANDLVQTNLDNPNFIILDVRTPGEFNQRHIANAQNIDFYNSGFQDSLNTLNKTKIYFIYCASGNRSGKAMNKMKSKGFQTVYNLLGGIGSWINAGYDVVTP